MPASHISLGKAKSDKLFYFVANVLVYRESDRRCLLLKRSETETAHPGKWAFPGGKLEWADLDLANPSRLNGEVIDFENAVEDLLARETLEEAGVTIDTGRFEYINSVAFVRPDGIPVVLLKFAAPYVSGDVAVEEGAFTDHAWASLEELKAYDCIEGIPEEVAKVLGKNH
jgi:8-oxo-dGTP pyrophosphatase MutT (NUDIX family)